MGYLLLIFSQKSLLPLQNEPDSITLILPAQSIIINDPIVQNVPQETINFADLTTYSMHFTTEMQQTLPQNRAKKMPAPIKKKPSSSSKISKNQEKKPISKNISSLKTKDNIKTTTVSSKPVSKETAKKMPILKKEEAKIIEEPINLIKQDNWKASYRHDLLLALKKNKFYPLQAKRLRQTGKVKIQFVITPQGIFKEIRLIKSSDYQILNQSAIKTVRNTSPFRALPIKDNWQVEIELEYKIP